MLSTRRLSSTSQEFLTAFVIVLCFFLLTPLVMNDSAAQNTNNQESAAEPGATLRRELAPAASHTFTISLSRGTLFKFAIQKGDLGLKTTLYGPTGSVLLEHISQDTNVVVLSFPIQISGTYKLELNSLEKTDTRSYELKIDPLTPVTERNRKQSEAQQALSRAEVLRAQWTESSLLDAIAKYDTAVQISTTLGDLKTAAAADLKAGDVYFLLCRYPEALRRYQAGAALSSKSQDWLGEANAASSIAKVYTYRGDVERARQYLDQALENFRRHEPSFDPLEKRAYGEVLSNLGELVHAKGDFRKASAHFEEARKFCEGDRKALAKIHLFNGYIAGSFGNLQRAIEEITLAIQLYQATNDRVGEARSLTAKGIFYLVNWKTDQAIELHNTALEIFRTVGDHHSEAVTLNALGQANERSKELAIAQERYEEALRLFESIHAPDGASMTLTRMASLHADNKEWEPALSYYERALRLSRGAGRQRNVAYIHEGVARVYMAQGRYDLALKKYQEIREFYQTSGDKRSEARAFNVLGDLSFRMDQKHQALEAYQKALALSRVLGDPEILTTSLYNLAKVNRQLGLLDEALSLINESIQVIEKLRSSIEGPDFRVSYFSGVQQHYDLCVNILMQLDQLRPGKGFATDALLVRNNSHARLLRDLVGEPNIESQQGVAKELLERKRELRGQWRAMARYYQSLSSDKATAAELAEVDRELVELRAAYQEVEAKLRQQNPRLVVEVPPPLDLKQIQTQLQDDDILLEYFMGDERSYLWVVTRNSNQSYELAKRKLIEDAVVELLKSITARQGTTEQTASDQQATIEAADKRWHEQATVLGQMLWTQVASQLGTKRILVVPDGALQNLPFDVLPVPGRDSSNSVSLETNEVVVLPSFSTLVAVRNAKKHANDPSKLVAVIADPVFGSGDDRLPSSSQIASLENEKKLERPQVRSVARDGYFKRLIHSSEEADAISATVPNGTVTMAKGFEATREAAMKLNLGQYQVVHLATHGFLDSEHPEFSGVAFSMVDQKGAAVDGLMLLHDIYSLDLSAELTVLSACQTALGKDIKGEGMIGLTHSFMSAGSKSVVASLWKVDDRATSVLMADFYELMFKQGMSPAAALRQAKLDLRRDPRWSAPYYWAGFVIQGEYANRIVVPDKFWSTRSIVLLLVILTAGVLFIGFKVRRWRGGLYRGLRADSEA